MNICISSRQQKIGVFQSVILVSILLYMLYDNRQRTNEQSPINYQLKDETNNVQQISLSKNFKTKRLPDVIIVGVKKSGTVTLAKFLDYHPSIAAAGEISFFEKDKVYNKGIEYYRKQMPEARDDQVVLVKTPAIFQQYDPVKVLKRQRERLVSDLAQFNKSHKVQWKKWKKPLDINQLIMGQHPNSGDPYYIAPRWYPLNTSIHDTVFLMSNYSNLWEQLTTVYPKEQILLLNGNDFTSSPLKVMRQVENFIGVPHFFMENHFNFLGRKGYPCLTLDKDGCAENNKGFEHPELHEETLTLLRKHFEPMLKQFEIQTAMKIQLS